jgi:hypothetical protein
VKSFRLRSAVPRRAIIEFDLRTNEWLATFKNANCEIIVISDRCHADDVGGARCD